MNIVIRDLDKTRIKYEATVKRVGEGAANKAFSRALNHEGRKTYTAVKRALRKQTSIPAKEINASTKVSPARVNNLSFAIKGRGRHLGLDVFKARQFGYGVRAKVWGEFQKYPHAFIVPAYSNRVFIRQSKDRFPLRQMWGPAVPKEMLKDATKETFEAKSINVLKRASHELDRILTVG